MAKSRKTRKEIVPKVDGTTRLEAIHHHAAGIDVGSAQHYVAVPVGRDLQPVQTFGSFTAEATRFLPCELGTACGSSIRPGRLSNVEASE